MVSRHIRWRHRLNLEIVFVHSRPFEFRRSLLRRRDGEDAQKCIRPLYLDGLEEAAHLFHQVKPDERTGIDDLKAISRQERTTWLRYGCDPLFEAREINTAGDYLDLRGTFQILRDQPMAQPFGQYNDLVCASNPGALQALDQTERERPRGADAGRRILFRHQTANIKNHYKARREPLRPERHRHRHVRTCVQDVDAFASRQLEGKAYTRH